MLELFPPAAMQFTESPQCSALDLHELRRQDYYLDGNGAGNSVVSQDWHVIREMLYSFAPTLASHRHRQELLDRCVHIVIDEMNHDPNEDDDDKHKKKSSFHWYNRTQLSQRRGDKKQATTSSNREKCPLQDLELSHSLSAMELAARQQFKIRAPSSSIHHQLEKIRGKAKRQSVIARLQQKQKQLQALVPLSPLSASTHRTGGFRSGGSGDDADVDTGGVGAPSGSLTAGSVGVSGSMSTDYHGGDSARSVGAGTSDHDRSVTSGSASSGAIGGMTATFRRRSNNGKNKRKTAPENSRTGVKPAPSERSKKSIYDEDGIINLIEDLIANVSSDEDSGDESSTSGFGTDEGEEIELNGDLATCSEGDEEIDDGGYYTTDNGATTSFDDGTATLDASSTFGQSMDLSVRWTGSKKVRSLDDDVTDAFDLALMSTEDEEEEEKKEEDEEGGNARVEASEEGICAPTPKVSNLAVVQWAKRRPECLSEVGMRLWTFFALYLDPNNPSDTYVSQVAAIFDEIRFSTVEKLVALELPPYAASYLVNDRDPEARSFRDIASPKCRELIHKTCFFVGKYDFHTNEGITNENVQSSGKGMDDNDEDILVQRCHDGHAVVVRAHEWTFTTQEETDAVNPGISEAAIWKTGEIPSPIGVTFRAHKRDVFVKFSMDENEYLNEVACRKVLESHDEHISMLTHPLLAHYSALGNDRSADRSYRTDIGDERFKALHIYPGKEICLGDYPYAIVCPRTIFLAGRYARYGVDSVDHAKEICQDVGNALVAMHSVGVVHGDLSMRNIALGPASKPIAERTQWTITDFTKSSILFNGQERQPPCLGQISSKGVPLFSTGTIPPEQVVKLNTTELRVYQKYWQNVERMFNIHVDTSAMEPFVDLKTGATYAVRCYFNLPPSATIDSVDLPNLPYSLVTSSEAVDIWAFGLLLFELCAGRPLLPIDSRTGRLLDYKLLEGWNTEMAESLVFEHVSDPIAQDLLLMLLSPVDIRSRLTMTEVMNHAFFQRAGLQRYTQSRAIIEKRREDTAIHKRNLRNKLYETSEEAWINPRTYTVSCWDFNILPRFAVSPCEIVKTMMGRKTDMTQPCSFVALPYKLCRSRSSLLTPKTRKDIEKAEALGASLLGLSKACHFAFVLKKATLSSVSYEVAKWTSTELFGIMDLSPVHFGDVQTELAIMAAKHVESFRHNPMSVAIKVVQARLQKVLELYKDSEIFVYHVDEYRCLPLVEHPYIVQVGDDRRRELLERCILPMQLACVYSRGVFGDAGGLVKLIFEAAYPHAPQSWVEASAGLSHSLDEESIVGELKVLEDTLVDLFSSRHRIGDDDVSYMHDFCSQMDPKRRMGGLCRVLAGDACLWTTSDGASEIVALTTSYTLKDALRQQQQVALKAAEKLPDSDKVSQNNNNNRINSTNPWAASETHEVSVSTPSAMDKNQPDEQEKGSCPPVVALHMKENENDRSSSPLP
jgi:serine/threonine protein kinase